MSEVFTVIIPQPGQLPQRLYYSMACRFSPPWSVEETDACFTSATPTGRARTSRPSPLWQPLLNETARPTERAGTPRCLPAGENI
jgi:hypothetical protein